LLADENVRKINRLIIVASTAKACIPADGERVFGELF
jgi:hypothetical protein